MDVQPFVYPSVYHGGRLLSQVAQASFSQATSSQSIWRIQAIKSVEHCRFPTDHNKRANFYQTVPGLVNSSDDYLSLGGVVAF